MATVGIIGAGELGGAVADALARAGRVASVLIIDAARGVAAGKALDIQQAGAIKGFDTRVSGTDDFTRIAGCSICVIADRAGPPAGEWQGDDGLAMVVRALPYLGDGPLVFAGAAQAGLMESAAREAHMQPARLIGSAAEALASALTAVVAMEAGCSPTEICLTVVGSPPRPGPPKGGPYSGSDGFVVPWSEASIGGYALERVLTQVQLHRLQARAARLWPPGPFTLGLAAARVAEAAVTSSRRAFSVLTVLGGELGVRERAGALPALLSTSGIVHMRVPTLSPRERVQLMASTFDL
jgi:malate dehydrogenase